MRVLLAHNIYRHEGGEERAVEQLRTALQNRGHAVDFFSRSSRDWDSLPATTRLGRTVQIPYSLSARREIEDKIQAFKPDVLHVHNLFPFLSPSVYDAARRNRIPIVQTLHNFRPFCMNGLLFRDGHPCELCVEGGSWHGFVHGCYQNSRAKSGVMAASLAYHRLKGTWADKVDAFIALSEFSRELYRRAGFPAQKMTVIPNAVEAGPAPRPVPRSSFLYMGRLSHEKGIDLLLEAFQIFSKEHPAIRLNIAGTGPLEGRVKGFMEKNSSLPIHWLGYVTGIEKSKLLEESLALVFPSECYENGPFGVLEALIGGLPVIGSRRGPVPELVRDGKTGWLFEGGSPDDLARRLADAVRQGSDERESMRRRAWEEANSKFSVDRWAGNIEDLYDSLLKTPS